MEACILKYITASIHAPLRIFYNTGILKEYYGEYEYMDAILNDEQFRTKLLQQAPEDYPRIYQDFYPVNFCVIKQEELIYITGPVTFNNTVEKIEGIPLGEYFSNQHHMGHKEYHISFCEFDKFCEENLLLFNVLKHGEMTMQEMLEMNYPPGKSIINVNKQLNEIYFRYQENEKVHNSYDQEVRELSSIREGNVEKLIQSMNEMVEGEYATLSKDSLRSLKNLGIVTLATSARAAIDGGIQPEEAFSIDDAYILQVDQAMDEGRILALVRQAKIEFATKVKAGKSGKNSRESNRIIEEAKRITYKNLHNRIYIRDIAKKLEVTPEYLSALFRKLEDMTVNDYIIKTKIGLAENLLIYSDYSIEDISYYLGFCSQSHFGTNFKKWAGLTPKQYRLKYGKQSSFDTA